MNCEYEMRAGAFSCPRIDCMSSSSTTAESIRNAAFLEIRPNLWFGSGLIGSFDIDVSMVQARAQPPEA